MARTVHKAGGASPAPTEFRTSEKLACCFGNARGIKIFVEEISRAMEFAETGPAQLSWL